jgi:hypothetical protein
MNIKPPRRRGKLSISLSGETSRVQVSRFYWMKTIIFLLSGDDNLTFRLERYHIVAIIRPSTMDDDRSFVVVRCRDRSPFV